MPDFKFAFFGTPEFGVEVLSQLERLGKLPRVVVCQPDRPKGRGRKLIPSPVKVWAQERSLEILQPTRQKDSEYLERFVALGLDVALVAAYGQLLTRAILDVPRLGFINVHPSRIPKYRGAAPMQWTLIKGDRDTAVTILKVTPRLDEGDILLQQDTELGPDETLEQLATRLGGLGGRLASQVLDRYAAGDTDGQVQDESKVVWAPELKKSDGQLDWSLPALDLHNRIRGVQPWPGASTTLRGRLLKIHQAGLAPDVSAGDQPCGQVLKADKGQLVIQTGRGALRLLEVQAEGKKRMTAQAFLAGRQVEAGDKLG